MGGVNSGRRRSIHRGAVEQYAAIDLRVLRRAGLLSPGQCTYTTLHWRNQAPEALSARIFIDLSDAGDASMRIVRSKDHGAMAEPVAIECVPCPYGGVRCYFLCPLIGVRCEQLFLADRIFASRKAHKPYGTQRASASSRTAELRALWNLMKLIRNQRVPLLCALRLHHCPCPCLSGNVSLTRFAFGVAASAFGGPFDCPLGFSGLHCDLRGPTTRSLARSLFNFVRCLAPSHTSFTVILAL